MKGLWRTTIHIWTDVDPQKVSVRRLAEEADDGDAICTHKEAEYFESPSLAGGGIAALDFFREENPLT